MSQKQDLYQSIRQIRQSPNQPIFYRILLAGYFNEDELKKQNTNPQKYLKDTIHPFLQQKKITGYLYLKGVFYLHLIESKQMKNLNEYINSLYLLTQKQPQFHNIIRIVHQSYECPTDFFRGWECDYLPQNGPILNETDKTQEQIADRSYEIYENIEDGAKIKKQNSSHKLANMFLLSNDDMAIMICKNFMSLEEYHELYLSQKQYVKECEGNYPLPPNIFNTMEFLELEDYTKYS